jgi:hypothetical protein
MACEHSIRFEVSANLQRRILRIRLAGGIGAEQMQAIAAALSQATSEFRGKKFMVTVDSRGLRPLHPHLAKIFCEVIAHGRKSGCALCVHLSDYTVERLNAHHLARENSVTDDFSVDVSSESEAERVTEEARARLDDGRYGPSVRDGAAA